MSHHREGILVYTPPCRQKVFSELSGETSVLIANQLPRAAPLHLPRYAFYLPISQITLSLDSVLIISLQDKWLRSFFRFS